MRKLPQGTIQRFYQTAIQAKLATLVLSFIYRVVKNEKKKRQHHKYCKSSHRCCLWLYGDLLSGCTCNVPLMQCTSNAITTISSACVQQSVLLRGERGHELLNSVLCTLNSIFYSLHAMRVI